MSENDYANGLNEKTMKESTFDTARLGKESKKWLSTFGITWSVVSSGWLLFMCIKGWLTPSHAVLLTLNDYGEMWFEIPMFLIFFLCWCWWFLRNRVIFIGTRKEREK